MTATHAETVSRDAPAEAVGFTPALRPEDAQAAYWLRQATLRLRREIAWRWHLHDGPDPRDGPRDPAQLPPREEPLVESLDLTRYAAHRQRFFESDATARYLCRRLEEPPPAGGAAAPGGFGWAADALGLDEAARFALALALLPAIEPAAAPVIAACQGTEGGGRPTAALAARLWADGGPLPALADPRHPLWGSGLLCPAPGEEAAGPWDGGLSLDPAVALRLVTPDGAMPAGLTPLDDEPLAELTGLAATVAGELAGGRGDGLRVVPILGPAGAGFEALAAALAAACGRRLCRLEARTAAALSALLPQAWLQDRDPLLDVIELADPASLAEVLAGLEGLPVTLYLAASDRRLLDALLRPRLLPVLEAPRLDYQGRLAAWRRALGGQVEGLEPAIAECARRFRYEAGTIARLGARLRSAGRAPAPEALAEVCRAEAPLDMGELAERIVPRFGADELVLPPRPRRQFEEVARAMRALTEVHYRWGTARAWNESGISVLFAGPPGTGKTMAAEVLAARLGLPLYRIDLSQVVNKYIGETEKNLKRIFDLADVADTILFFDEADSLFGRRTEVKDAHDRYANLEVSYLLQRMERFKGLAILATNRRKDLDDAFLRRLREIIEFPMPDEAERRAIWQGALPEGVDAGDLDLDFLAKQFALAGGHIRSILLNACLQAAEPGAEGQARRLPMAAVIVAVKREYDKLGRSVSLSQFGRYAPLIEELGP